MLFGSCAPPMIPLLGGIALAEMAVVVASGARGERVGGHFAVSGEVSSTRLFPCSVKDQRAAGYPSFVPRGTATGVMGAKERG